ncbi:hypothetical protein ACIP9H_30675 [Streptomyces sp. NPDC088732]|uniref:hypothetical protein n=1 Tax=Streptomyces sp. NPDC088732 TaxID=3365879 RepID=UPI003824C913
MDSSFRDVPTATSAAQATVAPLPEWHERIRDYRQGDVVRVEKIPREVATGVVDWVLTPLGAAIITQTCDLVLADRPTAHLVPVVELPAAEAKACRSGRRPNLVHLPALGDCHFADLTYVATVNKEIVVESECTPGVKDIDDIRKFGQRVGRRFSRFAFPDEVVAWLRPLQSMAESKALKDASPIGWALKQVASLRLLCAGDWVNAPHSLTLWVVLEPGVLPPFPSDAEIPGPSEKIAKWLYGEDGAELSRKHGEIAEVLQRETGGSLTAADRFWLWSALAEAWAAMCTPPKSSSAEVAAAVEDGCVYSEIASAEDFSFDQYRRSEEIDLDHLSSPLPI